MPIPTVEIIHSLRSSISIQITPAGKIIVKAPFYVSDGGVRKFLQEKQDWIEKMLSKVAKQPKITRAYQSGEAFLYLGKEYLFTPAVTTKIALKESSLLFPQALLFRAKKEIGNWYIAQAKEVITRRLDFYTSAMKSSYKTFFLSNTSSKWGTCFPDNTLQFNWRLIMAPLMVVDYVVIHELAHTKEKNHGDNFWRIVRNFTPAYRQHRKWLETNAQLLTI